MCCDLLGTYVEKIVSISLALTFMAFDFLCTEGVDDFDDYNRGFGVGGSVFFLDLALLILELVLVALGLVLVALYWERLAS